ncbi:YqcC family protein [Yersinia ruckeri]|uniref:Domain of uncharacterized function, DUF446 n=1 Tax=Yersinia ruckeri TaxID=29486 RepID=A0A085U302_YERRU|nr:YqcC family protein [Yersinia ruckeri]AJI94139.1 tRNA pseudouridine synthase C family protein [Yersinia ruckeri]AKA38119.1 hypothetical protein UGYR_06740 [Yersinia ruckeri]ARZ00035.1 hypothetical protein QMA0440_00672 [Yersinia ruckeri]AUQ42148.1 hypothetical protein NJ56_09650 [Yersinia ruckeri]EKN3348001.1 YqcC family protein [Yersinia ruckeri]
MSLNNQVRQILQDIDRALHVVELWQETPPEISAFDSTEPFCVDTMAAEQWLQWVLLPRMYALLDGHSPLPTRFAVAPYFEVALKDHKADCSLLLAQLQRLDDLLNIESE